MSIIDEFWYTATSDKESKNATIKEFFKVMNENTFPDDVFQQDSVKHDEFEMPLCGATVPKAGSSTSRFPNSESLKRSRKVSQKLYFLPPPPISS